MSQTDSTSRSDLQDELRRLNSSVPPGFSARGFSDSSARLYGENLSRATASSAPPTSFKFADLRSEFIYADVTSHNDLGPQSGGNVLLNGENKSTSLISNIDTAKETSRTMSYSNLAMALGEDLAEYIGESTDDINLNDSRHSTVPELR